jgi:hypothetical protein
MRNLWRQPQRESADGGWREARRNLNWQRRQERDSVMRISDSGRSDGWDSGETAPP